MTRSIAKGNKIKNSKIFNGIKLGEWEERKCGATKQHIPKKRLRKTIIEETKLAPISMKTKDRKIIHIFLVKL
jgi:hypothetical protein